MKLLKDVEGVITLLDVFVVLDVDESTIKMYVLVMYHPPGPVRDLYAYSRVDSLPTDEKQARDIVVQVVSIITEVHKAGIYHQDLKHENILIETYTGKVHICDFGLAVRVSSGPYTTFYGNYFISCIYDYEIIY